MKLKHLASSDLVNLIFSHPLVNLLSFLSPGHVGGHLHARIAVSSFSGFESPGNRTAALRSGHLGSPRTYAQESRFGAFQASKTDSRT